MTFQTRNIRESQRRKQMKQAAATVLQKGMEGGKFIGTSIGKGFQKTVQVAASSRPKQGRKMRWFIGFVLILFGAFFVFQTTAKGFRFLRDFQFTDLIWIAGTDLPADENGFTNILLLGVGGQGHSGEGLTDTIIVASIDPETESVVMLSVPRDFYLDTRLNQSRINEVIENTMAEYPVAEREKEGYLAGVEILKQEMEDLTGLEIQRFAQVDFRGFEKGVDALGGIDITLEETIDDGEYPDADWGYQRFFLRAGDHHVDGATALKIARSRHDSSDFERSNRQRKILQAIQEKAISRNVLTSPNKLEELYAILADHVKTDLTWDEIIALAEVGYEFPRDRIFSYGLNNDETAPGGFLVNPSRALYGGASVLVPFLNLERDKYAQIHAFTNNIFQRRALLLPETQINVLNATKISGNAQQTATHLKRFGIPVNRVENSSQELDTTEIRFDATAENETLAEVLTTLFPARLVPRQVPENVEPSRTITVLVGADHENYRIPESTPTLFSSRP